LSQGSVTLHTCCHGHCQMPELDRALN
jgi:hypothetical protein